MTTSNKLKCLDHDRRVMVVDGPHDLAVVVHRTGAKERCFSEELIIRGSVHTPTEVLDWDRRQSSPAPAEISEFGWIFEILLNRQKKGASQINADATAKTGTYKE